MGGTITVQSKKNEGSTFTVILPLRVMESDEIEKFEAQRNMGANSYLNPKFEGRRILLVEDNEMNRDIATEILEDAGLIVENAEDDTIAVKTLEEKGADYYDFILMDIQMPFMNGYEATKAIRAMYPEKHIPIVALSANAFAEDKAASLAAGMDDHVAKPINISDLFNALSNYI